MFDVCLGESQRKAPVQVLVSLTSEERAKAIIALCEEARAAKEVIQVEGLRFYIRSVAREDVAAPAAPVEEPAPQQ